MPLTIGVGVVLEFVHIGQFLYTLSSKTFTLLHFRAFFAYSDKGTVWRF
jgi:hypothetical protein